MKKHISQTIALDEAASGSKVQARATSAAAPSNGSGRVTSQFSEALLESVNPRLVIRGENPQSQPKNTPPQPNPNAAIIDWLNFTFVYTIGETPALLILDEKFRKAFGFGIEANRNRGHLNYLQSWELGNSFGIFATGGNSVGGTCFFSISSDGCTATKDWVAVHDLLVELSANITRLDLAHDDYEGTYNIQTALSFYHAGEFNNTHGRPPKPKLIDDFDTGAGKTFYLGNRKNGKLLRVYEKGKQLGDPLSNWVRWELELHNSNYTIPICAVIYPGYYLAGSYPCLNWISEEQLHFESTKQSQFIAFNVLKKSCRDSYGKLIWTMKNVLGYSNEEIIKELSKEGVPTRLLAPVVGGGDAL